jgi:hypothetical protein
MTATGNLVQIAVWERVAFDDAFEQHDVISYPFSAGINA